MFVCSDMGLAHLILGAVATLWSGVLNVELQSHVVDQRSSSSSDHIRITTVHSGWPQVRHMLCFQNI
jgi:hypothetical protein